MRWEAILEPLSPCADRRIQISCSLRIKSSVSPAEGLRRQTNMHDDRFHLKVLNPVASFRVIG